MHRALFLCSRNRLRSPTAEQVFTSFPGVETDSAGLSPDADQVLSSDQVDWATIVFVMEAAHRRLKGKRVVCLDIRDEYGFMQPELVALLLAKVGPFLSR
jgi:predicted protein tyrosine phosphatase